MAFPTPGLPPPAGSIPPGAPAACGAAPFFLVSADPIRIERAERSRLPEVDLARVSFGRVYSDHMLSARCRDGEWTAPEITPFRDIALHPATAVFHYAQAIFEGMKAHLTDDRVPVLFRPRENWRRMNRSARRMVMAEVPEELFLGGLRELVRLDRGWIPDNADGSLYIRPFLFASDPYIGVSPSREYRFHIFTAPVGAYYEGSVSLYVTRRWIRAAEGGIGEAKAAGNYSAGYFGMAEAREHGCDNVLWLDSKEHRFVEECGTMNMMFVFGDRVATPPLGGTILPGVTRDSAIRLLREQMGREVEERPISIEEVADAHAGGTLRECFGVGTAAVVTPVARLTGGGVEVRLPEGTPVQDELRDRLTGIRLGRRPDPYGWVDRLL